MNLKIGNANLLKSSLVMVLLIVLCSLRAIAIETEHYDKLDNYVDSLITKVRTILDDKTLEQDQKITGCKMLLENNLDLEWMARFSLGRHKKTITDEQLKDFTLVYAKYVTQTYADLVKNYKGEKAIVKNVHQLDAEEYVVKTEVMRTNGQPPIKADYLVRARNSDVYKVADVITEGVSMISSQQSEFGSIISSGGFDALLKELHRKIDNHK
jgi:phospholipid transport system substrate-binding protein